MVLALNDKWIWAFWLARNGDEWHIYFLQADKSLRDPELRHRNVSIGHARSSDLRNWTYLGTCFAPAAAPAWDDWTTWTGSVLQGPDGTWHLYYTGTGHADGGVKQRIGHATSTDMHNWQRVGDGLALDISGSDYEDYAPGGWPSRAMRDPWVMKDPNGVGGLMFFTARVQTAAEANAAGAIGFATSPDFYEWTIRPPIYRGGLFAEMEDCEVFERDRRWYCLFSASHEHWSKAYMALNPQAPVRGTHYLMADDPLGPWRIAPGPFLDGTQPCRRYAGKIVDDGTGLVFLSFLNTVPKLEFVGEVIDPIPVTVDEQGLLALRPELAAPGSKF